MTITLTGNLSPAMRALADSLSGARQAELSQAMGEEVQQLTADYLQMLAGSRHATASRLGAAPSNHLGQAAEKVAAPAALSATAAAATLTINHPGMSRALRDVTILPRASSFLAIPMAAAAYNRRPAQIWAQMHLFAAKGKIWAPQGEGQPPLLMYVLVRSVTQKQDRTLLPSDAELARAAREGALNYIRMARSETVST